MTPAQSSRRAAAAVGRLTEGELGVLCRTGRSLQEIGDLAGVTRQRVHQAVQERGLARLRDDRREKRRRAESWWRYAATTGGQRLVAAAAELRRFCPDLPIEWRESAHAWHLFVAGRDLSVYDALSPHRYGGRPGARLLVYRAVLRMPNHAYLVRCGDGRRFLILHPPRRCWAYWEAESPWRRGPRAIQCDREWRIA